MGGKHLKKTKFLFIEVKKQIFSPNKIIFVKKTKYPLNWPFSEMGGGRFCPKYKIG